jgi:hypothetical protein
MRLIALFLLILLAVSGAFAQGWVWQNPLPSGNGLSAAVAFNQDRCLAFGACGTALLTTDGGLHWSDLRFPLSADLYGAVFLDSLHGWVVGGTTPG